MPTGLAPHSLAVALQQSPRSQDTARTSRLSVRVLSAGALNQLQRLYRGPACYSSWLRVLQYQLSCAPSAPTAPTRSAKLTATVPNDSLLLATIFTCRCSEFSYRLWYQRDPRALSSTGFAARRFTLDSRVLDTKHPSPLSAMQKYRNGQINASLPRRTVGD